MPFATESVLFSGVFNFETGTDKHQKGEANPECYDVLWAIEHPAALVLTRQHQWGSAVQRFLRWKM